MTARTWVEVSGPVFASVGPVRVGWFDQCEVPEPPDNLVILPPAWLAVVRVTFKFGELVVTKAIRQKYCYPVDKDVAPIDREAGRAAIILNIETQLRRHGIPAGERTIEEIQP